MSIKILIVEDEFIVGNALRLAVEQAGYSVTDIVPSAENAEESLQKKKPDLVLLDIRLEGERSGIDLAKRLRAENIAFIYLSANSSQKILEEARITEPYGFLVKPFREKDLLVALDIALYRHKHSLESKLRQEDLLQKQLTEISNEMSDANQKLLHIAQVVQPYIPFDLIVFGGPLNAAPFKVAANLRIGFDEYQFIGEKELATISGLSKNDLSLIIANSSAHIETFTYADEIIKQKSAIPSLQKILFDSFSLQSGMTFPVTPGNSESVHFSFYSRQLEVYTKYHLALLNRLKACLTDVAEKTTYYDGSSTLSQKFPDTDNRKFNQPGNHVAFKSIIGNHPLLLAALDLTMQVAPYNTSVLLLGESGTGKEKIAQSIHSLSSRKNEAFVKVNCAAIPTYLIESELFGHEKGAFTGAIEKRKGKFELADRGTIFLDEIGELPLDMQVKLLRVLQEKEIEYVGGSSTIKVNVRIIAATNRNLEKEVADGNFRLDLYYRLNVFPITLPALRKRKSDIELLALFFTKKFCKEFNKVFTGISSTMMEALHSYDWPGNIRELENVIEHSIILNDEKSKLELKRSLISAAEPAAKITIETLQDVKLIQSETERAYIISILKKTKGRIRGTDGAAELLNIKPTTLASKITKLNINRADFMNYTGHI